jgi:hypothetical protein
MELVEALAREGKIVHQTINVKDLTLNVAATGSADGFGSALIGGLPKGNILLKGCVSYLRFEGAGTGLSTTWSGDYSIGTTETADATLNGTDANIVPSTALDTAVAGLSDQVRGASTGLALIDNTAGNGVLAVNLKVDNADFPDDGDIDFAVNGIVHLSYEVLGDDNF